MSARGGLRGAGGEALLPPGPRGHRKGRCSSHPTSRQMMLAFLKYGVTSRKNFTVESKEHEMFVVRGSSQIGIQIHVKSRRMLFNICVFRSSYPNQFSNQWRRAMNMLRNDTRENSNALTRKLI